MNRKLISTLMLAVIFVLIAIGGSAYTYYYQGGIIEKNQKELKDLQINSLDTEELNYELNELKHKVDALDSILAARKYIIPQNIPQSNFFKFINNISSNFSDNSFVNLEYVGDGEGDNFPSYLYTMKGTSEFNDLFKLIYAVEQSKELKKIVKRNLNNFVEVDEDGYPHYLVSYDMQVKVFYADNDLYASSQYNENEIESSAVYNIFYPLIREEIPPNNNGLLDVQSATLLALIPDGAYLSDASGKTHLLWEGDEVYLGYLTKIDYIQSEVKFILNKGGIIEKVALKLDQKLSDNNKTNEQIK